MVARGNWIGLLSGGMAGMIKGFASLAKAGGFGSRGGLSRGSLRLLRTMTVGAPRLLTPRRCSLPSTALRVTPPSTSAICEALLPARQSWSVSSMRSAVHTDGGISGRVGGERDGYDMWIIVIEGPRR